MNRVHKQFINQPCSGLSHFAKFSNFQEESMFEQSTDDCFYNSDIIESNKRQILKSNISKTAAIFEK